MRQFTLKNSIGEVYRLNSLDYFLHDPEGLGFRRNTKYQKIGNNYEILRDGFEQQPITASIMFKSSKTLSAYRQYSKFREFLQLIPLTLIYRIPGGEYHLDCIPESVEKTEINSTLGMDIGITLTPLTMWYREVRDIRSSNFVEIESDSNIDSPCCITITPAYSSSTVTWTQFVNNERVSDGKLVYTPYFTTSDVIYIRTDTNPYQIYKINNGNKIDLYEYSDFSKKRFITLKKGRNLITSSPGGTSGAMSLEARIYYETV